jgi:hypothetical protein
MSLVLPYSRVLHRSWVIRCRPTSCAANGIKAFMTMSTNHPPEQNGVEGDIQTNGEQIYKPRYVDVRYSKGFFFFSFLAPAAQSSR